MHWFLKFIFGIKLYMFRTVPPSIISFSLYTQQWHMSYRFADSLRAGSGQDGVLSWSCSLAVSKPVWHLPLLCVQWKTPDDGRWNCPKHVEFYSKNKFEKSVHLFSFITRIYKNWKKYLPNEMLLFFFFKYLTSSKNCGLYLPQKFTWSQWWHSLTQNIQLWQSIGLQWHDIHTEFYKIYSSQDPS